jgi:hypothetical protein
VKSAIVWILAIFGALVLLFALLLFIAPQGFIDFLMQFGSAEFDVPLKGGDVKVHLNELGEGVENTDRLFVMKKMVALYVIAHEEGRYWDEVEQFNRALVAAGEDRTLSYEEFHDLKMMYADILPEEKVENWLKMAREYERIRENEGK